MTWSEGEIVVRREWRGSPWMAVSMIVVADEPGLLATYLPPGAQFAFPTACHALGPHPWQGRGGWKGHGVLMLHRPGESYSVWHFWDGAEREFAGAEIGAMLDRGAQWWDPSWSRWEPNPGWSVPAPDVGWEAVPTT